jgi:hypothetical protein
LVMDVARKLKKSRRLKTTNWLSKLVIQTNTRLSALVIKSPEEGGSYYDDIKTL